MDVGKAVQHVHTWEKPKEYGNKTEMGRKVTLMVIPRLASSLGTSSPRTIGYALLVVILPRTGSTLQGSPVAQYERHKSPHYCPVTSKRSTVELEHSSGRDTYKRPS